MNIKEVFTGTPLYKKYEFPKNDSNDEKSLALYNLICGKNTLDMYCIECKNHSVFKQSPKDYQIHLYGKGDAKIPIIMNRDYEILICCSRNENHQAMVLLKINSFSIIKVGQFPSLADILTPDLKKYKTVLGEDNIRDWSKAIGLTAHGIGAGSYVYLRRIIESLIEDAHLVASQKPEWDDNKYKTARYSEKIQCLSGILPDFIVENKNTYGILSKGVHELDEETCLKYFNVINSAIELIGEEKLAKLQIDNKKKEVQNALSKISSEI